MQAKASILAVFLGQASRRRKDEGWTTISAGMVPPSVKADPGTRP